MVRLVSQRLAVAPLSLALGLALALFIGCNSSGPMLAPNDGSNVTFVDAGADSSGDGLTCDPAVTYATFGMAFFATYCSNCHQWDQMSAQDVASTIIYAAGPGGFMPPGPPTPTDDQRARLAAWLACGAP